jgi:ATP adenylyltransferase
VKQLWSPWRMQYILQTKSKGCVFCEAFAADRSADRESLILYRGVHCCVIMNLFPYNNGHLMVVPLAHQPSFQRLPPEALLEIMDLVNRSVSALQRAMDAQGFNIGVNMGKIAGAGISEHVHVHIVPRWAGDTNFITTLGEVRCIPESLQDSYDKLKAVWDGNA